MTIRSFAEILKVFDAENIAAGASVESNQITLDAYAPIGFFSAQLEITGSGAVDVQLLGSLNGVDFLPIEGSDYIIVGGSSTSGPNADGKVLTGIDTGAVIKYIKIKATETSGTDSVTLSLWFCVNRRV